MPKEPGEKEEDGELDPCSDEPDGLRSLTVTSRVMHVLGDVTANPAYRLTQWLQSVRRRSGRHRASSPQKSSIALKRDLPSEHALRISLLERLNKANMLDIDSNSFSWDMLSSLHHTEHSNSAEYLDDETNKAVEVTINSGGVVFFALFNQLIKADEFPFEAAAVIKFSSSRMATQSERLGYEFANWLGVKTPQTRVIHNCSPEWLKIKEAAEKARSTAILEENEIGEVTCSDLLEALDLSRCLLLMSYVHGSSLLESSNAFELNSTAEKIAEALGRLLVLDLVIRNEDRFPCHELNWRGNPSNLLLSDKMDSAYQWGKGSDLGPMVIGSLQKERRATSVDSKLNLHNSRVTLRLSDHSVVAVSPKSELSSSNLHSFQIVAIDSGVPRRPPAGKRANDQAHYPKLVELVINSSDYSSNLLFDITGGKLGSSEESRIASTSRVDMFMVVGEFQNGFRAALRDLQGFHLFILTLHQKLNSLLRAFLNISGKITSAETEKEDLVVLDSCSHSVVHCSPSKSMLLNVNHPESGDSELQKAALRSSSSGFKEGPDTSFSTLREFSHVKLNKGSGDPLHSPRLTTKIREIQKFAKVDPELHKELENWNETLKNEVIKLCHENNFNTGFFECGDNCSVVDAYELKIRLEHILERISLISDAANTEKPSSITSNIFIGGALAARSIYTLQYIGITHILCLCANEIGQSDSQCPELFEYKNFSICDSEDADISSIFEEASAFIDHVESMRGKVLVHCFEGRSRSATLVVAYFMLRKKLTLLESWNNLSQVHKRANPNEGFARTLLDLDKKLHGKASMDWRQKKPIMRLCPACGKSVGLSSSSLKLHVHKFHKTAASFSVDSAITLEIQKALDALNLTCS